MKYKSLQIQISENHKDWGECDRLCFSSKNLYNKANYIIRQNFVKSNKFIPFKDFYHQIKLVDAYKEIQATKAAIQIVRDVMQSWKAYFESIKEWRLDQQRPRPRIPKYKDKIGGRFQITYTNQCFYKEELRNGMIHLSKTNIKISIPPFIRYDQIKEVVIAPTTNHYLIVVNYIADIKERAKLDPNLIAAADLGINNLATIVSNKPNFQPFLVNGKILKSINQFYNKKMAFLQSALPKDQFSSCRIKRLTRKRNNKIKHEMHCASKAIVKELIDQKIGELIIGKSLGWKQGINIGSINNQKFVFIPHGQLIHQLRYKFEELGGKALTNEESYTSQASLLDLDHIPVYKLENGGEHHFSGKRIYRGLYKSKSGKTINADVNAGYNILRKVVPKAFSNGIEGVVVHPRLLAITA